MSTATWSTNATPLVRVGGAVVHILGLSCIVHAAVTLALGGAAWNLPAHACMGLAGLLAMLHLHRLSRHPTHPLHWDAAAGGFRVAGRSGPMALVHAWHGAGWMTLRLRPHDSMGPAIHMVVWKSATPAPLWSELALRIEAGPGGEGRHQNKENP